MNDQWKRLDGWLKNNLPDVAKELHPGCSEQALSDFETTLGLPLPNDLKAFYRIHDGQPDEPVTGLFYGMPFLSLANAAKHWQMWKGIRDGETALGMAQLSTFCKSAKPGMIKETYTTSGWVAFARDSGSNYLGIDLDPGPNGTIGQVINFGRDEGMKFILAPSFGKFVDWLIAQYEAGNTVMEIDYDGNRVLRTKTPQTNYFLDSIKILFAEQAGT